MAHISGMAAVAALIGDPARASMLSALLDGRARTATELALEAGVGASTASGHLARLLDGQLVTLARQGRHRYYRLASPEVGRMLEAVLVVADERPAPRRATPRTPPALRFARTCYDHLAGRLAVELAQSLVRHDFITLDGEAGSVTPHGHAALAAFGLDMDRLAQGRRVLCRPCLDWSERRPHLGGALGAALCSHCETLGWIRRAPRHRAVEVTEAGRHGFARSFALDLRGTLQDSRSAAL